MDKNMDLWDIATSIEDEIAHMGFAVAVLNEAAHYFDSKDKQKYLPFHADHIYDLPYAVLTLLYDREENLKAAANQLYEKYSEEKKHGYPHPHYGGKELSGHHLYRYPKNSAGHW